ncbi:MAG TPA: ribosome small subunit-dependent GTPase A [Nocardioidaceae bacterium]|nr:ribosome small subunit-dependent GTPase A [Nocardioidaceae bacterium]
MTADPRDTLAALGWDDAWADLARARTADAVGRVSRVDRGVCTVMSARGVVRASFGGDLLDAMAHDSFDGPCTGDWVTLRHWPDERTTAEAVLDRRSSIVRADPAPGSKGQVLAANVTHVGVVAGLDQEPSMTKLERMLAIAWQSGAAPLVLLTKADLAADASDVASDVRVAAPGVDVVCCSTVTGDGLDVLGALLGPGTTLALLGSSGAGKSSLVNALVGAEVLTTKQIRTDGRGRHTSVRRELIVLPDGGAVIDTPGLRGMGLYDSGEGIAATFADIAELERECRFTDCAHDTEPGCAVIAAVESGELTERRLESWRKLQREQAWMAARKDARLRSEQAKVWKQRTKASRSARKRR